MRKPAALLTLWLLPLMAAGNPQTDVVIYGGTSAAIVAAYTSISPALRAATATVALAVFCVVCIQSPSPTAVGGGDFLRLSDSSLRALTTLKID